jgi:DNA-binding GntR family transcriptional regulator
VFDHLRRLIIAGEISAGTVLSQAELARAFGTSRTPVREAIRMLQREKLVEAEPNNRARVLPGTSDELQAVYALRIFMEPLGLALSIPRMTRTHFNRLDARLQSMSAAERANDFDTWIAEHRLLHSELSMFSGAAFAEKIYQLLDQSARFQYLFRSSKLRTQRRGRGVALSVWRTSHHRQLVDLCKARDVQGAYLLMVKHLAESGTVLEEVLAKGGQRDPHSAMRKAIDLMLEGFDVFTTAERSKKLMTTRDRK